MRFAVLGPLEIRGENGELLDVPGAKERRLLALLTAASPHVVTVDQLAEQLWDGSPPPSHRKSLQAIVVRLRTALEPGRPRGSPGRYVVRRQQGYALVLERDDLDVTAFTDRVSRGRALLASGDAEAADATLREALELWRGDPYADWPDVLELENERVRLADVHDLATEAYWEAQLTLGRHDDAVPELRRLTLESPLKERWWGLLVLALYRAGSQGEALDTLRRARAVLSEELGVDPGLRLRELEQAVLVQDSSLDLAASRPARAPPVGDPVVVTGCPWKGLARYESRDAGAFRGRARLVSTVVAALVDHPVVVLSGSSGAGKSSVARAGVVPALSGGALPGSDAWHPLVLVPGARPVDALASLTGDTPPDAPVALVCDQLEQLWSPEVPAVERVAFLDTVLGLVADDVVARALLVVRGDHVGRLAEHPDIAETMLGGLVMVPPMTELELRQVVEEPASAAGLQVEPELTEAAARDVLGRTGALPLLSTALVQTWERRRDHTLTLAGYLASGGVTGAVGRSAERVHAAWSDDERSLARRILVRLAEQDDDGTVRARRLPVAELAAAGTDQAATDRVVDALVAARLVAREDAHLEVAHEALLTSWPRLAAWLEEDSAGRAVRRHLAPDALEWESHDRPADELYRGARLEAAAQWVAAPGSGATRPERDFVESGLALAEAELRAARERAESEAAGRRRTRRFAALLAGALVLALLAAGVALVFQRRAGDQAAEARAAGTAADANRLAALSASARSLDLSLLLSAAAVRTGVTPATRDGLLSALVEHRRATGVRQLGQEGIAETALSANGRTMVATKGTGGVVAWRTGSADPPNDIASWWPENLAVSPDGTTLVAAAALSRTGVFAYARDGSPLRAFRRPALGGYPRDVAFTRSGDLLLCMDQVSGAGLRPVLAELDLETGAVRERETIVRARWADPFNDAAAFSDDASTLVVWHNSRDQAARMDVRSGEVTRLDLAQRDATSLELAPLPDGTAQMWSDGAVTLYDAAGRAVQELNTHRSPVRDVRVLPGGRSAVTAGDGGQVDLWNVSPDGHWSLGESLVGHSAPVVQVEPSADGRSLLTSSSDGQLVTWDLTADAGLGEAYPGLDARYVSNRLEVIDPGRLVVAPTRSLSSGPRFFQEQPGPGTYELAATFLDPRTGRVVDEVVVGDTGSFFGSSVAVNPDASLVSVTSILRSTVLDTRTKEVVAHVRIPDTFLSDSSWLPDGSALVLGATTVESADEFGGALLVVDTGSWRLERTVPLPDGEAQVLEWSPDDAVLAVGAVATQSVFVYDDQLRELRTVDLGDGGAAFDLSFSPDGRLLAAGRTDGTVSVVDTRTWRLVHEPARVHAEAILDVEWLPDSNTVVTAGKDEMVSLYDVERDLVRGRSLTASGHPGDGFTFLLPSPTDEVVVFNEGEAGHRYPLDPAQLLAQACRVAGRDLTRAEWERYLPDRPYRPVCPAVATSSRGGSPEAASGRPHVGGSGPP